MSGYGGGGGGGGHGPIAGPGKVTLMKSSRVRLRRSKPSGLT